eukprot:CAMPEP_0172688156 /NCGR_PEP_ID=MMETSP1074-20121228/22222_1 /TAXON_ID=2916 /ORGANISM="Ceratium fusus, Strain PA161109" /LENGTH=467 /DNA_ID=CAMNT_0013507755 /DNA_START=315 /DNA_END=1714 /DNA_ORIENTATION=-
MSETKDDMQTKAAPPGSSSSSATSTTEATESLLEILSDLNVADSSVTAATSTFDHSTPCEPEVLNPAPKPGIPATPVSSEVELENLRATVAAELSEASPESVVRALIAAAGPNAGVPPPEVVGIALRTAGVPLTIESAMRALREASAPGVDTPSQQDIAVVLQAATLGEAALRNSEMPSAAATNKPPLGRSPEPEEVVHALKRAAGIDNETPPPEVVGAALRAAGVEATVQNVMRALQAAAGPNAQVPSIEDVTAASKAMRTSNAGQSDVSASVSSAQVDASPEAVVQTLLKLAGPGSGVPPPEIVGAALRQAGVPATPQNVARALQEAGGLGSQPASKQAIEVALKTMQAPLSGSTSAAQFSAPDVVAASSMETGAPAAMTREQAMPEQAPTPPPALPQDPSPEQVVHALIQAAGAGAGTPPPDVVGSALRMMQVPPTQENIVRALQAAAGLSAGPPTPQDVAVAL